MFWSHVILCTLSLKEIAFCLFFCKYAKEVLHNWILWAPWWLPIVCFLLNKHLFAFSTVEQCWLSRQGWMEAGVPSWVTKEAALESQHCAYGTQTHIFRSLGCGLSILQTFRGLFGKAWLFCKTRQTCPCKKQLGPALQEVRRTGWKSDPWPPSKPHFNHCHLWNAFPDYLTHVRVWRVKEIPHCVSFILL